MKMDEFQKVLQEKKIDAGVFFNFDPNKVNSNFFYFVQSTVMGVLLISKRKRFLIVPKMELEKAKAISDFEVVLLDNGSLVKMLKRLKVEKLGLDYKSLSMGSYEGLKKKYSFKPVNLVPICEKLRVLKTEEEIKNIKKAVQITDDIFNQIILNIKNLKTEKDLEGFIYAQIYKKNVVPSFSPIVASGKNASIAHHEPSNKNISRGFLLMDFGVKYNGYCSDISRTIFIGKPTQKEKDVYSRILSAQKKLIQMAVVGAKVKDLDAYSRKEIGNYPHSLGHGLGVDVHEMPGVGPSSKAKLEEGMVITIEPGVYVNGKFGIRIEDDVLVKGDKPVQLTRSIKELIIIN